MHARPKQLKPEQLYIPKAAVCDATLPTLSAATKKSDAEAPLSL
jgi:hypothetical protein